MEPGEGTGLPPYGLPSLTRELRGSAPRAVKLPGARPFGAPFAGLCYPRSSPDGQDRCSVLALGWVESHRADDFKAEPGYARDSHRDRFVGELGMEGLKRRAWLIRENGLLRERVEKALMASPQTDRHLRT